MWWRLAWLMVPATASACLLNPQSEDPVTNDSAGTSGGTSVVDAGPGASGAGGASGSSASGGFPAMGGAGAMAGAGGSIGGTGGSTGEYSCPTDGTIPPANDGLIPETGDIADRDITGILGSWYTLSCDGAAVVPAAGAEVVPTESQICFSGTVPQADVAAAEPCWGASIGFDLCAAPDDPSTLPEPQNDWTPGSTHTASECGVVVNGVSFELTGEVPPGLSIVFQEAGRDEPLSAPVTDAGPVCQCVTDVPLPVDPNAVGVNPDDLEAVHFHVAASESGPVTFDFCVTSLSVW